MTQWSEQTDSNLHGRSSWLCDCFSAQRFILCPPVVVPCLAVFVSSLSFLRTFDHPHMVLVQQEKDVSENGLIEEGEKMKSGLASQRTQ